MLRARVLPFLVMIVAALMSVVLVPQAAAAPRATPAAAVVITPKNFASEVLASPIPVVLVFSTDWAGSWNTFSQLSELADTNPGVFKAATADINIPENITLMNQFVMQIVPAYVIFRNGVPIARHYGRVLYTDQLAAWISGVIGTQVD